MNSACDIILHDSGPELPALMPGQGIGPPMISAMMI